MIIEKTIQGARCISDIVDGHLFTRRYFYYTKKEAIREFKREARLHRLHLV